MEIDGEGAGSSTSPTAWFEFVLDETLLERHLAKPDAAADLISLFLYQADVSANIAREINGKENVTINGDKPACTVQNKKITVLKLLAIKTACHLKWSLSHFERLLPLSITRSLFLELLKVVGVTVEDNLVKPRDLVELAPEALFAVLLHHRWSVYTMVRNCFPRKPSKVPNVQVPGLLDASISSNGTKEAVLKSISENLFSSIEVLESYVTGCGRSALMPTSKCIGSAVDELDDVVHFWSNGIVIEAPEMMCQVSFDLGCIYFQQQNYVKADSMFRIGKEHFSRLSNPVYVDVDESQLHGYSSACEGILGRAVPDTQVRPLTLYQRVLASVQNNFQGLTALLIEDLQKQELSSTFRATLEESTHLAKRLDSLHEEVLVCNALRHSLDGHVTVFDLVKTLNRTNGLVDFFVQVCLDIYLTLNAPQRENLRLFLRNLCHTVSSSTRFSQKLLSCNLATLFTEPERDSLMCRIGIKKSSTLLETSGAFPPPVEENLKIGEMEQELLVTCDPVVVKELVQKVASKIGNNQAVYLTDVWRLPPDMCSLLTSLPVSNMTLPMCTHILFAKARICVQLQQYDVARSLLIAADTCIKELSFKLSKVIRWEILKVDLLQISDGDCAWVMGGVNDPTIQEHAMRAKACISSLVQLESADLQPSPELVCYSVAFLLNLKDWDFLSGLPNTRFSGFLQFGQLIALLCKEVPQLKAARVSANKFIEAISLTFAEVKRPGVGVPQRDFPPAPILLQDMLIAFITKIKEPMVLSLFVSCVTKLFSCASVDVAEEIFSDYVALWPTGALSVQMNAVAVSEVVIAVMDHVLSVNPRHPSWLRTQADIYFAQNNYWQAMRYYLELGVVTTDFFSESVTKNVYNEQVYRRMIRCCSQLNNHTQVAVLCQFLDEVDYTVAFKALQERATADAMDAYYDCISDTTILEYLINLHTKKGELDKRQYVLKLIGQMELNSNNREDVLNDAARVRKSRFLRMLSRQFLGVQPNSPASVTVEC